MTKRIGRTLVMVTREPLFDESIFITVLFTSLAIVFLIS